MMIGDATGFTVYGNPSDELKEMLKGFNGEYMSTYRPGLRVKPGR